MEDECDVVVFGVIDPKYEFSAPQYYDFEYEETQADVEAAERWFFTAITYEASPHVSKTKSMAELFTAAADNNLNGKNHDEAIKILAHVSPKPAIKPCEEEYADAAPANFFPPVFVPTETLSQADPCTPAGQRMLCKGLVMHNPTPVAAPLVSPLPAKRLYSEAWGASNTQVSKAVSRSARVSPSRHLLRNGTTAKKNKPAAQNRYVQSLQDTQPRKKQKLDGGRLRQIPVVKEQKPKTPALTKTLEFHFCTETRSRVHATDHVTPLPTVKTLQRSESVQVGRAVGSPFMSMAEKVRRFQLKTPERFHMVPSRTQMEVHTEKPKMRLTRPKTPELETMQRARPPRVKSANEIEEEMLAKMPKFKARPLPKKILEAPSLPMLTKSTPQIPEFKEFHLRTMERAQLHPSNGSAVSTSSTSLQQSDLLLELQERRRSAPGRTSGLMEVCPPRLHTASRARPTMVKSRDEMEAEELAKVPKFKARPLNKRIFKSRGDLGIFRNQKREVTLPHEFHFKTDERAHIRCPAPPIEQFGKLTIKQGVRPRSRKPVPFHLQTDVLGLAKKMKMIQEQVEREQREAKARIPKAQLLPYTTDYPIIPPKPEPKECTKPEPFHLESIVRHEEEQRRMAEERAKLEEMEASLKEFHAQPNLSSITPVFVPTRSRKPLTEIYEFKFNVDTRAIERAMFDQKVTEKHNQYKLYREEYEAARKAEEEKFIRAMRREMVPIARPMPQFPPPFVPQRSSKELTRPVSPHFSQKQARDEFSRDDFGQSITGSIQKRINMR